MLNKGGYRIARGKRLTKEKRPKEGCYKITMKITIMNTKDSINLLNQKQEMTKKNG